ncbi:MAG TPA: beta-Ala-His dipeptidase [Candidatus Avilachnospira avistercoris]|nr:beta-Ala-His dipeptidase [Candidatus Avilachnospira avistercoris]
MGYITKGLEPSDALRYFEEISAIPRASKNEAAIADYICGFAKEHGLWYRKDEANNVIVKRPGSKGHEDDPALILQGHTDMVCVKLPDCKHDFDKDPIELEIKDGWLTAKGTTLGADDGIAVAYMLAFLAKEDLVCPPLECIFTSMEEIGLLGAAALDTSDISGRMMINMDGGASEDHMSVVSSAGGQVYDFYRTPTFEAAHGDVLSLTIRGLLGGHSAIVIDQGRGNALKLMARMLSAISKKMEVGVVSFSGGMKMNAIVSDADAVITVPEGKGKEAAGIAEKLAADIKAELKVSDPGFEFKCVASEADKVMSPADSKALIAFIELLPDGIHVMSQEMKGLILLSSNVGVLELLPDGRIHVLDCIRAVEDTLRDEISQRYETLASLCGFEAERGTGFGSWAYDAGSKLRALCSGVYKDMFGKDMVYTFSHGGLECGELRSKIPDLDIVCMCPTAREAHTTEEALDLASFKRMYDCLVEVMKKLCEA